MSRMKISIKGSIEPKRFEVELREQHSFVEILVNGFRVAEISATDKELPRLDISHGASAMFSSFGNYSELEDYRLKLVQARKETR